ncbi:hypothetical protein G3A43_08920 [Paraburkholderia aspalathi]|nr:hypothetical protein [Paraburkholderia aspalathi]MBK3780380.1 hypothetical protein [Paraburkholderia aspalathi]
MNLLVIDATRSRVAFAVFSATSQLEEILEGHFDSAGNDPLSVKDSAGRELVATPIPQGLGDEAYLAWLMQWLEARNIRVDLVSHRVTHADGQQANLNVIHYMSSVYRHVPQVACGPLPEGLVLLALESLASLSLPLPIASKRPAPLLIRNGVCAVSRPSSRTCI